MLVIVCSRARVRVGDSARIGARCGGERGADGGLTGGISFLFDA